MADGGWIYVSNSEVPNGGGGVSAVRFAPDGAILDAYAIASGTDRNCSGGATSWGTWLSCEEVAGGRVLECDPTRRGDAIPRPVLGSFRHEAVAEDRTSGIIYETEDAPDGRLYRYVPPRTGDLVHGRLEAAKIVGSRVTWVEVAPDEPARSRATTSFAGGEGIVIDGPTMFVTTKGDDRIWELGLGDGSIRVFYDGGATPSVLSGVDQIVVHPMTRHLFVAEDGGNVELVEIALDTRGRATSIAPFLRFEGHDGSEITGPAFTADGRRLYVSSQRGRDGTTGLTVEITGPFETWPEVATVSGRWQAERLGSALTR
jgi:secreted PhoX family phosphatase